MGKEYRTVELTECGTLKSYLFGFFFSLALTLFSYFLISLHLFSKTTANILVAALALMQVWMFLFLFLSLGKESKPRWNSLVFLFMVLVTIILVFGSLWIMYHLNYNLGMNMEHV